MTASARILWAGLPSRSSRSERRLERVAGIEPAYSAWKAAALPLSYTRIASVRRGPGVRLAQPKLTATRARFRPSGSSVAASSDFVSEGWWRGLDSNQRTLSRPDLQSGAFNHSTTPPYAFDARQTSYRQIKRRCNTSSPSIRSGLQSHGGVTGGPDQRSADYSDEEPRAQPPQFSI